MVSGFRARVAKGRHSCCKCLLTGRSVLRQCICLSANLGAPRENDQRACRAQLIIDRCIGADLGVSAHVGGVSVLRSSNLMLRAFRPYAIRVSCSKILLASVIC